MTGRSGLLCLTAALLSVSTSMIGQDRGGASRPPSTANGDWPHYTADMRGTKYSPLDQINAANFKTLEVAWRFKTDILGPRPEYKLEGTPLAINGVLYATGGPRRAGVAPPGQHAPVGRRPRWQDRRAAVGAQPARGQARRRVTAATVRPRAVVLERWARRRTHPLRDDRLSAGLAQCAQRRADRGLRQGRHRRSEE